MELTRADGGGDWSKRHIEEVRNFHTFLNIIK
jgi:hypothetical protein